MSTYEITGQVDTVALKLSYGETWQGLHLIPPFWLTADNQRDAERIAEDIIDPLHLCTIKISAQRQSPVPSFDTRPLAAGLYNAVDALNGDSNDEEHDALLGMSWVVADILGVNLDELLENEGGL